MTDCKNDPLDCNGCGTCPDRESYITQRLDSLYDQINDPDDDTPLTMIEDEINELEAELHSLTSLPTE